MDMPGRWAILERHLPLKTDVRQLLAEAKSVISLAINYYTLDPPKALAVDPARGQISRYAWGDDYHDVIRQRLSELVDFIKQTAETELRTRVCVDTAPIIEREYAQKAGLGWIGKNTNLIHWRFRLLVFPRGGAYQYRLGIRDTCCPWELWYLHTLH